MARIGKVRCNDFVNSQKTHTFASELRWEDCGGYKGAR